MMLTPKQQRFVAEYLKDLNATEAARRVGYHPKMSAKLVANSRISAAIAEGKARQLQKAELSAMDVLEEIRRLSFSNVQDLFDETGNLRPIHTLTREQASCIASLEVIKKNAEAGDGKTDIIHKLRVWDKTKSLEMLAKHFALLTERVEHGGGITIRHELPE